MILEAGPEEQDVWSCFGDLGGSHAETRSVQAAKAPHQLPEAFDSGTAETPDRDPQTADKEDAEGAAEAGC